MTNSLYEISVLSFLQGLSGAARVLDLGLAYCQENGIDPSEFVEASLYKDMRPLRFQVVSIAHHSVQAIEDVKRGLYLPPAEDSSHDYAGLQKLVADARDALQDLTPAEVDAVQGRDVVIRAKDLIIPFTAEAFLMSISIPNFHFHATTAYNILRSRGVPLGKLDYTGPMRTKT